MRSAQTDRAAAARKRTVAITGASGNLGQKLISHFASRGWQVIGLDKRAPKGIKGAAVDLRARSNKWINLLDGVDTVIHLAAQNPFPHATWKDSVSSFDITANVFMAAMEKKVRRVIFASSNHVMGGLKEAGITIDEAPLITPRTDPCPGTKATYPAPSDSTPYATAKLFGERLAKALSELPRCRTSFICLRIGWCQPGANLPLTMSATGAPPCKGEDDGKDRQIRGFSTLNDPHQVAEWFQLMWLSNRDFLKICEKAMEAKIPDGGKFCVVNAMSSNSGMRWDISETTRILGFASADDSTVHPRPDGDMNIGIRRSNARPRRKETTDGVIKSTL